MSTTRSARYRASPSPAGAVRLLALAAAALALALGCGGEPAPPTSATPPDTMAGCPSGSVEWTDGSCMPVGIQGCAAIFLEEDGLCHPRMAKCPAGTIPKFDEGCVPVGIQGCAAMFMEEDGLCHPSMAKCPGGTIPKFDEGCVPVGIQGCAEVFMEDDGLCHPTMEKCPAGTFAVPQQGCLPIDGPDGCGSGTWGNLQEDPNVETVWVDPSVVESGDESKTNPVKTIAEALAEVPVGGRIALGTGTYDEPIHIEKPMTIDGRCPSMVRVQGIGNSGSDAFVVWVDAADNVTLRGLEIGGAGLGILASYVAGLNIEGVHVRSATTAGLAFQGSVTEVSIAKSWIDSTLAGNDGLSGHGVNADYGARATFAESAIVANHEFGVFAGEAEVTLTDSLVEGTLPREIDGQSGGGIYAGYGAKLTFTDSAVVKNHEVGVGAIDHATTLTLTTSLVEGTLPSEASAQFGFGAFIDANAGLTLLGTAIIGNHSAGIVATGTGTEATITGSLVEGTLPQQSDGTDGTGVAVVTGAKLTLRESAIVANYNAGMVVSGTTTNVMVTEALIERQGNSGITVLRGASMMLDRSGIVENRYSGISTDDADTDVTVTGSLVAGTLPTAGDGESGKGLSVIGGAHATLRINAIVANRDVGLYVQDEGTEVMATDNLIAETLGRGVNVQDGAALVFEANAIFENHEVGLHAGSAGTMLTAKNNLVEGTLPDVGKKTGGRGINVETGAQSTLEANAIVTNHDVGLYVSKSSALATGNIIEGTLPRESDGQYGVGVVSFDGATLQLTSSVLQNNRVSALQVVAATASVSQSLIDGVHAGSVPLTNGMIVADIGDGVQADEGSPLDITDTRIQGCVRAGVLFDNSSGTLSGVLSTGNQFGLVLQGDPRPSYQDGNNQFTENTAQDILLGGDLPVPDAPSPVPPSP